MWLPEINKFQTIGTSNTFDYSLFSAFTFSSVLEESKCDNLTENRYGPQIPPKFMPN
jgi:hypothetical protein